MAEFDRDKLDMFLGVVRKYMQIRGPMSQKELALLTDVGISTMSRFINQKTTDINPQVIAKIVAKLSIPLAEIIDFVDEEFGDKFVRLVKFYKEEATQEMSEDAILKDGAEDSTSKPSSDWADAMKDTLGGTAKREAIASVSAGGGRKVNIPFGAGSEKKDMSLREKLERLTPRQQAYMAEFVNLDMEGRDLIVDLGNSLFRYFRQKGMSL